MRIDLHLHTTASDGQYSPEALIQRARRAGLNVIAITDHDSVDGLAPAQAEAQRAGALRVLPGIELSAEDEAGDVHMLGYCFDPHAEILLARLADFRAGRYNRGQLMIAKLAEMGMPLEWSNVLAHAGADKGAASIGRPHIARAMIDAGYVSNVAEAFDRYLYNGGPAYVPRARLTPEEAIALIHAAGGAAVLAHPGALDDPLAMIERLIPAGLDGVEVMHPKNDSDTRLNLLALARRHDLIVTGGSDFHGDEDDTAHLIGVENPPADAPARLEERAARRR
ncbi:MAG: PHP domain-containing protein [Anaerolinea sp.]|nr:PHP domain-containing protein [Anaerolinea sp.]